MATMKVTKQEMLRPELPVNLTKVVTVKEQVWKMK